VTLRQRAAVQVALGIAILGLLAVPVLAVSLSGAASTDALWTALRLAALEAFTLIFADIVIGAFRPLFNRVVKPRTVHRLHVATGATGFFLAVAHAIMLLVLGVEGYRQAFVWVGPAVLVVLALAILVAYARRKLRRSWRWIHRLNYLIFAAVLVHGFRLGYDFGVASWLKIWFVACTAVVAAGLVYRLMGLRRRVGR
jgi:hypothetical protein